MSIVRLPYFRLFFVLILMFILSIIPLPSMMSIVWPLWVMLFMFFIQVTMPSGFRVGALLLVGLTLDTLCFSVMGEHAAALILTAWLASHWVRRFNFFSMPQQIIMIAALCFVYQSILYFFDWVLGYHPNPLPYLMPILSTTFLWPWFKLFAHRLFLSNPL